MSKINYVFTIESGGLLLENFCDKYTEQGVPSLLNNYHIGKMQNILTSHINLEKPVYKTSAYINYEGTNKPYQIVIAGNDRDLNLMIKQVEFARDLLFKEEISAFNQKFSKIKIICQGKSYSAFSFLPPNVQVSEGSIRYAYSKKFLYLSAIAPFLILCLLILLYRLTQASLISFIKR